MYAVEIKDVSKNYGSRKIFDHIKLNVNEGELVAVTGPSGCGKSTLLNMIGLWSPGIRGRSVCSASRFPGRTAGKPRCFGEI